MSRKQNVFLVIAFLLLSLSFYSNFFRLVPQDFYEKFDAYDKGFIYGKILNSEEKGIFGDGNFVGLRYDTTYINSHHPDTAFVMVIHSMLDQKEMYLGNMPLTPDYGPYFTQICPIADLYAGIHHIVPASPQAKLNIFDLINALINALVFIMFFRWILREYGLIPACVTLFFMLISTWFISFCGNIWWVAGSFFLPTFGLFLMLRNNMPEKKILLYLFLLFAAKCILTGFEFITCAYLSVFIPIIYYYYYNKKSFKEFFIFSVKAGLVCVLGVLVFVLILCIQHWVYFGEVTAGIDWIVNSFFRRTGGNHVDDSGLFITIIRLLGYYYWIENIFDVSRFTDAVRIPFSAMIGLVYINLVYLFFFTKKYTENRKYKALALATALAWIPSASWFIIFRNHAMDHRHIDFICWYFPFMLLGFVSLGVTVSILYRKIINRNN